MLALALAAPAQADPAASRFVVSVTVPERVSIEALEVPRRLLVTDADIARGHARYSARYRVSAQAHHGWLLRLSPRLGPASYVEIRGLAHPLRLGDEEIEVYRPAAEEPEGLALDCLVVLEPGAKPGSYPLPVHVLATPL